MRLMWITLKIPNEVIGFARSNIRTITVNEKIE